MRVPDAYYEGDWYHYGDNFVTKAVNKGRSFVVMYGFLIENEGSEDNLDLIPTSMTEYPMQ